MKAIITSTVVAVGLALCLPFALAKEKEQEEENINQSDIPAAVQKAGEAQAKGGRQNGRQRQGLEQTRRE